MSFLGFPARKLGKFIIQKGVRGVIQTIRLHLTKEVVVVSIPKVVGVLSCGSVLCLGLTLAALPDNPALAADEMNADQSADRKGGQAGIKGDQDKLKGNEINADQSVESYYGPTFSGRASGGLSRGKAAYMFQFVSHRGFFPLLGSPFFSISYE